MVSPRSRAATLQILNIHHVHLSWYKYCRRLLGDRMFESILNLRRIELDSGPLVQIRCTIHFLTIAPKWNRIDVPESVGFRLPSQLLIELRSQSDLYRDNSILPCCNQVVVLYSLAVATATSVQSIEADCTLLVCQGAGSPRYPFIYRYHLLSPPPNGE